MSGCDAEKAWRCSTRFNSWTPGRGQHNISIHARGDRRAESPPCFCIRSRRASSRACRATQASSSTTLRIATRHPIKVYNFFSVRYDIVHEHTRETLTSVQQNDTRDSNSLACYNTVKTRTNQNQVSSWGFTVVCNDVFAYFDEQSVPAGPDDWNTRMTCYGARLSDAQAVLACVSGVVGGHSASPK